MSGIKGKFSQRGFFSEVRNLTVILVAKAVSTLSSPVAGTFCESQRVRSSYSELHYRYRYSRHNRNTDVPAPFGDYFRIRMPWPLLYFSTPTTKPTPSGIGYRVQGTGIVSLLQPCIELTIEVPGSRFQGQGSRILIRLNPTCVSIAVRRVHSCQYC